MRTPEYASKLLRFFASERRRIVADWRILIVCRRFAAAAGDPLPDEEKAGKVARQLIRAKSVTPIADVRNVFRIDTPYADAVPVSDEQIVQEANPWAVFSHLTAMAHHAITQRVPSTVWATTFSHLVTDRLPFGTTPEDWLDVRRPKNQQPKRVGPVRVEWTRMKGEFDFGHMVTYSAGLPVYITDLERTLIDVIRSPTKAGGITEVLRAWRESASQLAVERVVEYTVRYNIAILRQRVGYLLEALHLSHPVLSDWRENLVRGSSVKLVADAPFAPTYSERWNLSLNVPASVLAELSATE